MLRRYSSRGLDGVTIRSKMTVGSAGNVDVKLRVPGVAPLHATIEYHPLTRSYWLRDHSLMSTTVNGHAVVGQAELSDGDLLCFGEAQPLVFQNDGLSPVSYMDNKIERRSREPGDQLPVLVGRRILPPANSNTRIVSAKGMRRKPRSESADAIRMKRQAQANSGSSSSTSGSQAPPFARLHSTSAKNRSVGNELLQRVVKLQGEVARRDEEMRLLRSVSNPSNGRPDDALTLARRENDRLREMLNSRATTVPMHIYESRENLLPPKPSTPVHEHQIYKIFVHTVTAELKRFADIILAKHVKDYSDIFSNFVHEMDEPFSIKMLEVEAACEAALAEKGYEEATESVRELFRNQKDPKGIYALSQQAEALWPVLRDAMAIARDSVRACTVFSAWSRRLGDHIRTTGLSSEKLLQACDDLKTEFVEGRLSSNWLPPSLTPLLRTAALELKKVEEGGRRNSRARKDMLNRKISMQEEVNLEVLAEIQASLEEEKKRSELLAFEKNELTTELNGVISAGKERETQLAETVRIRGEELEEERRRWRGERDEYERRIRELEGRLVESTEEKAALEDELTTEVERIQENVEQSVRKIRQKRSLSRDGRWSTESDGMSVTTPGMPIQRPTELPSPAIPAQPSPLLSLTDTENLTTHMESIEETKEEKDDDDEIGEDDEINKEQEGEGEEREVSEGSRRESVETEPRSTVGDEEREESEGQSGEEGEGEEGEGEEERKEEGEGEGDDREGNGDEEEKRKEDNNDGEENVEVEEKRKAVDEQPSAEDLKEMELLQAHLERMHRLREDVQGRYAPGSSFERFSPENLDSQSLKERIGDGNAEFRRTANFIRGLLALNPLPEMGVDEEGGGRPNEDEKREGILRELEELVREMDGIDEEEDEEQQSHVDVSTQVVEKASSKLRKTVSLREVDGLPDSDVTKQIMHALLDTANAPKTINEVQLSSHLQSHINSSNRPQTSRTRLPVKVVQVIVPNGPPARTKDKSLPSSSSSIRQPRFKF